MSIDRSTPLRIASGVAAVVSVAALSATPSSAAEVDFRPALTFGLYHDGNIHVVTTDEVGDEVANVGADLVLDRNTPLSTFSFAYHPAYNAYNKSEGLDYFTNTLSLSYTRNWSQQSRLTIGGDAGRTDRQGQRVAEPDRPVTFLPRTTQTYGHATIGGTFAGGKRALLDWGLRVGAEHSDDIPDDPSTPELDAVDFNDSIDYGARGAWRHQFSERSTFGLGVDAAYFDFENTDSVFVESLGFVGSYNNSRTLTLSYGIGGTRADSEGDSETGVALDVTLTKMATETSTFGTGIRQSYTPGRGLGGATQDRGGWVSYDHISPARGMNAALMGSYWQRIGLAFAGNVATADTNTFNVTGSVGWSFNRHLTLSAVYAYVDQRTEGGTTPPGPPTDIVESLETRYGSYGVNLRWDISGRATRGLAVPAGR